MIQTSKKLAASLWRPRSTIRKSLWVGVTTPLVLMGLIAGLYARQVTRLLNLYDFAAQSEEVISALHQTEKLLVDMETGIRGYLLAGKPVYLEPYTKAKPLLEDQFHRLRQKLADHPGQIIRLNQLEQVTNQWASVRENNLGSAYAKTQDFFKAGKDQMDTIRGLMSQLIMIESNRRTERRTQILSESRVSFATTSTVSIILGILLAILSVRLIRSVSLSYETVLEDDRKKALALKEMNETLESRVAERTLALNTTNQELEAFCYSVSHDLRAPLRGIDGFSKAILEDFEPKLDPRAKEYLHFVREGVQRMGRLIDDLLSLSRLTRAPLNSEEIDLTEQANEIVTRLRRENPGTATTVDLQPGVRTKGDPILLQAALENLLSNAWKFSSKTKVPHIQFGSSENKGQTIYFIRDNGAGFNMAYYDKLFGAFQRLHSAQDFSGTGIGLATVRRIIRRHGGDIWAKSAVGEGATFYFTLSGGEEPRVNT